MRRQCLPVVRSLNLSLSGLLLPTLLASSLAGQTGPGRTIRWWEGAVVLGGISAVMALDQPLQRSMRHEGSLRDNALADALRPMGEARVYLPLAGGILAAGALTQRPEVVRAGVRVSASLALASALAHVGKWTLGRPRPYSRMDADDLYPFSGHTALPSGHTAMAFALATALSDEIRQPFATAGLYALAGGTAWSRLNDNNHWLSDVTAGAALGVLSAKLATGRWRIFNLRPPGLLNASGEPALLLQAKF